MDAATILAQARDALTVQRVFGEPIVRDGVTIVPVAVIRGGGGGGQGTAPVKDTTQVTTGGGVGFGIQASPLGVYVIKGDTVRWLPAVDVNRMLLAMIAMAIAMTRLMRSGKRVHVVRTSKEH